MGVKSKHTEDTKQKAVKRYATGEPVRALAKEYKVSIPSMYNWITAAKEDMVEEARRSGMRPETLKLESKINLELLVKEQSAQIDTLKKKLFELMVRHGEL